MGGKATARARILEAAEAVVSRLGAARLTLDAVAAEAGLSKGGLLYHFATKEALLTAMIDHFLDTRAAAIETALGSDPASVANYLRANLEARIAEIGSKDVALSRAVLAAGANDPSLLERPRRELAEQFERLRREPDAFPDRALLLLAVEALNLLEVFACTPLPRGERDRLFEHILLRARQIGAPAS